MRESERLPKEFLFRGVGEGERAWKGEERVSKEAGASMKREVIKRNSNN